MNSPTIPIGTILADAKRTIEGTGTTIRGDVRVIGTNDKGGPIVEPVGPQTVAWLAGE